MGNILVGDDHCSLTPFNRSAYDYYFSIIYLSGLFDNYLHMHTARKDGQNAKKTIKVQVDNLQDQHKCAFASHQHFASDIWQLTLQPQMGSGLAEPHCLKS